MWHQMVGAFRNAIDATPAAAGGVTIDNVGTETHQGLATSASYTGVNVTTGSNRALVVTLVFGWTVATPTGVGVVWDSGGTAQAMTLLKTETDGINVTTQLWGLSGGDGGANAQPTVGNGLTVAINWTNTAEVYIAGISFHDVNQTTPFPNNASVIGATTYNLTCPAGDKYVQCMYYPGFGETLTGTTIYIDTSSGIVVDAAASYGDGAGTTAVGLVAGTHNMHAAAAVDVKAA